MNVRKMIKKLLNEIFQHSLNFQDEYIQGKIKEIEEKMNNEKLKLTLERIKSRIPKEDYKVIMEFFDEER